MASNILCLTISSLNLKPSSFIISSSLNTIALDTDAPRARFLDWSNSLSFIAPNVLALHTSLTNDVDEKSMMDSAGSF